MWNLNGTHIDGLIPAGDGVAADHLFPRASLRSGKSLCSSSCRPTLDGMERPTEEATFKPELIHSIFKLVWSNKSVRNEGVEIMDVVEVGPGTSKKSRPTTANSNALKVGCELLRIFVTEAVQRAAIIAEAEGSAKIKATHFERVLPQLLLDF